MEQRIYSGNVSPNGLADYLVNTFNQGYGDTVAQKMGQGDNLYVQVGILSHSGRRIRGALGLSIAKTRDGISITSGQSNWFDLNDPAFTGGIIAGLFFPPLWLFPLARGINNYQLYQDIWGAVDSYCLQAGARPGGTTTAHGVYCQNCGAVNDENATECALCGAPLRPGQAVTGSRMVLPPSRPLRTARMSFPICSLKPFFRPLQDAVSQRFSFGYGFAGDTWDEAGRGSLLCLVHLGIARGGDGFASP